MRSLDNPLLGSKKDLLKVPYGVGGGIAKFNNCFLGFLVKVNVTLLLSSPLLEYIFGDTLIRLSLLSGVA